MRVVLLIIITFLFNPISGWSKSFIEERFESFYERNLHYMAYDYMKQSFAMGAKLEKNKVYKVIRNIHPSIFKNDRHIDLLKDRSEYLAYIAGARLFFKKNYTESRKYLEKVSKKDPMYPERSFLMAMMKNSSGDSAGAMDDLKRCYLYANRLDKKFARNSVYPESIKNRCLLFLSRLLFEKKDYKQSLYFQHKMKKTEAVWPHILLDKAWNFYWLKRYEQVIGSLLTYQAPVIKRFMWPEAHYLRALTYFELCYFEKAESIYEAFDNDLYKMRNSLIKFGGPKHLMQLIKEKRPPKNEAQKFLYYLLKSYKQDAKYSLFKLNISQLNREINYLRKKKLYKKYGSSYRRLIEMRKILLKDFENYLVFIVKKYQTEILRVKRHFVKLRLELGIKKRRFFVKSDKTEFNDKFADLDIDNIEAAQDMFVWEFKGGFWADELGDYAVAVKSQCKKKK